jgi:hypothetical protein
MIRWALIRTGHAAREAGQQKNRQAFLLGGFL